MRTTLLFILCSLFLTANKAMGQETYKLDELEVTLPKGYSGYSRMSEGNLNTAITKEGHSPTSQLIIAISDINKMRLDGGISDNDLDLMKYGVIQPYKKMGIEFEPSSEYFFKNRKGFKMKGTGTLYDIPCKLIIKCFLFSHYLVLFQEMYGEDNEADYLAIENSLRISSGNEKQTGMQTISNDGYSFTYDADKLMASTKKQNGSTTFYFSCKDAKYGETFLQIEFSSKSVENLYGDAKTILDAIGDLFAKSYAILDMQPMERGTFLGKSGYYSTGTGNLKITGQKVRLTYKICNYNGKFTTGAIHQILDSNGQVPKEINELFSAVEASLKYSPQ